MINNNYLKNSLTFEQLFFYERTIDKFIQIQSFFPYLFNFFFLI